MSDTKRRAFGLAVLLSVLYDALTLLLGWLLLGPPPALNKMAFFKATVTVGLPSISQLLSPQHQVLSVHAGHNTAGHAILSMILVSFFTLVVFTFVNGCYLSLLGQSVLDQPKRKTLQDGLRAFGPLFVWMLVQMLVSAILAVFTAFGNVGFVIMVILLLLFRYWFLFFEYAAVVKQYDLRSAFTQAPQLRKRVEKQALLGFLSILVANMVLAELVNFTFAVWSLILFVLVNSFLLTVLQRLLLKRFLEAEEKS